MHMLLPARLGRSVSSWHNKFFAMPPTQAASTRESTIPALQARLKFGSILECLREQPKWWQRSPGISIRTTDGTIITLDTMSMIPYEESKSASTNNFKRDYASQIFAVVANKSKDRQRHFRCPTPKPPRLSASTCD